MTCGKYDLCNNIYFIVGIYINLNFALKLKWSSYKYIPILGDSTFWQINISNLDEYPHQNCNNIFMKWTKSKDMHLKGFEILKFIVNEYKVFNL
jgi:hypothetical protein